MELFFFASLYRYKFFLSSLYFWEKFKPKRSLIENVIKVMKKTFSLEKMHRFTLPSVRKYTSFAVLLVGITISLGIREKKQLQRLAHW
jgi:hypothetical protein